MELFTGFIRWDKASVCLAAVTYVLYILLFTVFPTDTPAWLEDLVVYTPLVTLTLGAATAVLARYDPYSTKRMTIAAFILNVLPWCLFALFKLTYGGT